MKIKSKKPKTLLILACLALAVTIVLSQKPSSQIKESNLQTNVLQPQKLHPDLQAKIDLLKPDPLTLSVEITNIGQASIKDQQLHYIIKVADKIVLNNTDTFTQLEAGDSINFIYEIPKDIYPYPKEGQITLEIDPQNKITELNKENNQVTISY